MKLELGTFRVKKIALGDATRLNDGELEVSVDKIREIVLEDEHFADVKIEVVHPGESVRIVHALDAVEPRYKVSGPGTVFPGVIGPPTQVGEGRTHRLSGMVILTTGAPVAGEPVYWREAIVDMSGPASPYSPFSRTANLVLQIVPGPVPSSVPRADLEMADTIRGSMFSQHYNLAIRSAGFKVASYLAEATKGLTPHCVESFELAPVDSSLPRVVYACEVLGEYLYGEAIGWQPTILHPNELFDGVLHRVFNAPAGLRNVTYFFQNHPIVTELYRRHGKELKFLGVILYPVGGELLTQKERGTSFAAKLVQLIGAQGVVLTSIGGGHPCVDTMLLCRKCEQLGVDTSLLHPEMARTQEDSGFVYFVPEADAIVSTGNYERDIALAPVVRVIGGEKILVTNVDARGPTSVNIGQILGATSPLGPGLLAGVQY